MWFIWDEIHNIVHLAIQSPTYLLHRLKRYISVLFEPCCDVRAASGLLLQLYRSHIPINQQMEKLL